MKKKYKITLLSIITLSIMSGCDSKTENNIQASIEANKTIKESKNIEITHNTNIKTKEENYKTVAYYTKYPKERMKKFKECENGEVSNYQNDIECDNALEAIQAEKRKNRDAFIHQDFMKK